MAYTDEELKRLKDEMDRMEKATMYASPQYTLSHQYLKALLSRLEAAEAVIKQLTNLNSEAKNDKAVMEAWRKAYETGRQEILDACTQHQNDQFRDGKLSAYEECAKIAESYLATGSYMNPQFPQIGKNLAEMFRQQAKETK